MRKILSFKKGFAWAVIVCITVKVNAQANQSLSNLTSPTSVNQHLVPNTNNTKDLGSNIIGWRNIYLSNRLFLKGNLVLHSPGTDNFFTGTKAGNTSLTGEQNTGLGQGALQSLSSGNYNTAAGFNALYSNSGAANNTAFGTSTLYSNKGGSDNTAFGSFALKSNVSGSNNTAAGFFALYYNTGSYNTATGSNALYKNIDGRDNTATGYFSLYNNVSGEGNTANGIYSLNFNIDGNHNTADGFYALFSNSSGYSNVAMGVSALYSNNKGHNLVAVGDSALYKYTGSGGYNTALGSKALYNTTGAYNTSTGFQALYNNSSGNYNTANGYYALRSNTTGTFNTALGSTALYGNTGSFNTAIGSSSDVTTGATNATALGFGAFATASNQLMLGNSSLTAVRTYGSIIWTSDGRFKKNIKENVPGLDFIKQLRPVTYNYDIHKLNDFIRPQKTASESEALQKSTAGKTEEAAITQKEKKIYTGFIAQEVEKLADKMGYDFSGVYKPQNDKDPYGLDYAVFVVTLVKAVQELSAKNDEKDAVIAQLVERVSRLEQNSKSGATAVSSTDALQSSNTDGARLEQNSPNPFSGSTTIRYHLPAKISTAQIIVTNTAGNTLKTFVLNTKSAGYVTMNAGELSTGSYHCTLFVDGKKADSKQMLLVK